MARFAENAPQNQKYEQILESRDKVHLFLEKQGVTNAGVGVGYNKNRDFCLVIHLENDLPIDIGKKLQELWPGTKIEVVGHANAY
jgi:hypothetical protein